jgi:hypothetical protein
MDEILTYILLLLAVIYFLYRLFWGSLTTFALFKRDTDKALHYMGKSTSWFIIGSLLLAMLLVLYLER